MRTHKIILKFGIAFSLTFLILVFQNCAPSMSPLSPESAGFGVRKNSKDPQGSCDNGQPYEGFTCVGMSGPPMGQQREFQFICASPGKHNVIGEIQWSEEGATTPVQFLLRAQPRAYRVNVFLDRESGALSSAVMHPDQGEIVRFLELSATYARVQLRSSKGELFVEALPCRPVSY